MILPKSITKSKIKGIISVLITILLVGFLISRINFNDSINLLRQLSLSWIALGILFYLGSYLARTLRFKILIHSRNIIFIDLLSIHAIHNMYNHLLPANVGEITYVYLLRKYQRTSIAEGIATLLFARVFDVIVIFFLFIISLIILANELPKTFLNLILIISILLVIIVTLIILLPRFEAFIIRLLNKVKEKLLLRGIISKLIEGLEKLLYSFKMIHSQKVYLPVIGASLLSIICTYIVYMAIFNGMRIEITVWKLVFASSMLLPVQILPIKGISGFGTYEMGWIAGLMLLGFSKEISITIGFTIHVLSLFFAITFGLIGYLIIRFRGRLAKR